MNVNYKMIHSFVNRIHSVLHSSQRKPNPPSSNIPHKKRLEKCNIGQDPSLKKDCQQMLGISPIHPSFFPPTKPTPPQVVVLREQPLSDTAQIAHKILMRERSSRVRDSEMNRSQDNGMNLVHGSERNAMISPPDPVVYRFNPLRLPQPNAYARREFLSQLSRGDIFRYHLIGNVFRQYLPTLLIGFHTWHFLVAPDLCLTTYEIFDLINPFSSTSTSTLTSAGGLDMDIGAVDGERAAGVLIPQSVEENLSNDDAAVAEQDGNKGQLALYISGILLAATIITFKIVLTKTHG